jgi:hypothetical protein
LGKPPPPPPPDDPTQPPTLTPLETTAHASRKEQQRHVQHWLRRSEDRWRATKRPLPWITPTLTFIPIPDAFLCICTYRGPPRDLYSNQPMKMLERQRVQQAASDAAKKLEDATEETARLEGSRSLTNRALALASSA